MFNPADNPEQRLILCSPVPEHDTPAKLAQLLEGELERGPALAAV